MVLGCLLIQVGPGGALHPIKKIGSSLKGQFSAKQSAKMTPAQKRPIVALPHHVGGRPIAMRDEARFGRSSFALSAAPSEQLLTRSTRSRVRLRMPSTASFAPSPCVAGVVVCTSFSSLDEVKWGSVGAARAVSLTRVRAAVGVGESSADGVESTVHRNARARVQRAARVGTRQSA